MCLYVKKGTRKRRAKRNLVVFKVLEKNNSSPYQNFFYEKGVTYFVEIKPVYPFNPGAGIGSGFHCYVSPGKALRDRIFGEKVIIAIIPKGSLYFIGMYGDIVSDKLLIEDFTEIKRNDVKRGDLRIDEALKS